MKLLLAVLMLFAGTMPAAAQWLDRPWPGIPRTADGKPDLTAPAPRGPDGRPDLTGVWNGPAPVARPDAATLQPWVIELARRRQQEYYKLRPFYQCLPSGPETERSGAWKRFLQTPTAVVRTRLRSEIVRDGPKYPLSTALFCRLVLSSSALCRPVPTPDVVILWD